jgi:hypothetical protein
MRIAIVNHGLPDPSSNGGPMTVWAVVQYALSLRHAVHVIVLRYPEDGFFTAERRSALERHGVRLHVIDLPPTAAHNGHAFWPTMSGRDEIGRIFRTSQVRPALEATLATISPDAVFGYHWDCLAGLHGLRKWAKVGAVGDPYHLPQLRRWQQSWPRPTLGYARFTSNTLAMAVRARRTMRRLLQDCDVCGTFQAGVTDELRRDGLPTCRYYRTSVVDPLSEPAQEPGTLRETRPTILLGPSNVEATSTRAGMIFFAEEILPKLEAEVGMDGFVVRVVGEGQLPRAFTRLLPRPNIVVAGRIEPPDDEFRRATLQLVCTPFVLGIRVRIITGLAFGTCVVAHASEAYNIPELRHDHNAMIGRNGAEMAAAIVAIIRQPGLRARLAAQGRATYEEYFKPEKAVAPLMEDLLAVATRVSSRRE